MMLKIAVCDDDRLQANVLVGYLEALSDLYPTQEVDVYLCGEELREHYKKVEMEDYYNIIFMDIEMEHCDGMDIAKKIKAIYESAIIIYVTHHAWLISESFEAKAFDFLVKPVKQEKFNKVFQRAYQDIAERGEVFFFKNGHDSVCLLTKEIIYFVCGERKAKIYTTHGAYEKNSRTERKKLYAGLNKDVFLDIHEAYIVNMNYIRKFERKRVVLQSGKELEISSKKTKEAKQAYEQFIVRRIL